MVNYLLKDDRIFFASTTKESINTVLSTYMRMKMAYVEHNMKSEGSTKLPLKPKENRKECS